MRQRLSGGLSAEATVPLLLLLLVRCIAETAVAPAVATEEAAAKDGVLLLRLAPPTLPTSASHCVAALPLPPPSLALALLL